MGQDNWTGRWIFDVQQIFLIMPTDSAHITISYDPVERKSQQKNYLATIAANPLSRSNVLKPLDAINSGHEEGVRHYGPADWKIDYARDFCLGDCDAGRWVAVSLPDWLLACLKDGHPQGDARSETSPQSPHLREILRRISTSSHSDPEKELRRKIEKRARELPFPGACLVKKLDVVQDFMPHERSIDSSQCAQTESTPLLAPRHHALTPAPLWFWEDDLMGQLAIITQSAEHVWLRNKRPILNRIRYTYAHMAVLLPKNFSNPHLRAVRPPHLKEILL